MSASSEIAAAAEEVAAPVLDLREEEIAEEETAAEQEEVDTELAEAVTPDESTLTPALSQREREEAWRQQAAARVREAGTLPAGIRERLAALVEAGAEAGSDGRTLVSLDDAIRALDESLPGALRLTGNDLTRAEHPSGGSFFRNTPGEELSEDEAESIARAQLARSGLLRGQRVRVAQD